MSYWTGLVEGFQGRREAEYQSNFAREQQNRQIADRVFSQLLSSRDPEMQSLALSGLMQPTNRKKGLAGFLGEVDNTNPMIQQILARANEMIPDERGAGPASHAPTPSGSPGSAAMSTNQPVRAGSQPIDQLPGLQLPPEPPPMGVEAGQGELTPPPLGPEAQAGGIPLPPAPPPESKFKRRGTGIPTAEEIDDAQQQRQIAVAQATAQAQGQQRLLEQSQQAQLQGASAQSLARLQDQLQGDQPEPGVVNVRLADGSGPFPARWLRNGRLVLADGTLVPQGATVIPTTAASPPASPADPLDTLLSPTEASTLGVSYGTTRGQAAALRLKVYTPDQRIRLAAIRDFIPLLKRAEALVQKVLPATGSGLAGRVESSLALAQQRVQGLDAYRQLQGLFNVMKGPTAKIIAAESGRLTQQDIERAATIFPNIGLLADSPDVARSQLAQFRGIVDDALVGMGEPPTNWDAVPNALPVGRSSSTAPTQGSSPTVGEVRQVQGEWMRIVQVYPDGTFDASPATGPGGPPSAPVSLMPPSFARGGLGAGTLLPLPPPSPPASPSPSSVRP